MSRSKESTCKEKDVPGDVKDAFESLEQKLDAGLADLMSDQGNSKSGQKIEAIDDDDFDDDINIAEPSASRAAIAAANDGAREAEAMARRMAEEAASFATAVAATVTSSTVDDVTSSEEHLASTTGSRKDLTEDNKEQAQALQAAALVNASQSKSKDKSSKQISLLLLGLLGLILALGIGQTMSNHLVSNNDDHRDDSTLFDIIKEWNTKHEKNQRYNEAMRNMLNPKREENNIVEEEEPYNDETTKSKQQEEQQQYLISGDGRLATLINTVYQPVYYVTYRPVQKLRYYYYHQTPSHQEEVVIRQSRGGGHQTMTYRKARIVQNVHQR